MFNKRASVTSRQFLKRHRSILAGLGAAALALTLTPAAFATTYTATAVNCTQGSPVGTGTWIDNPSPSDVATISSYNETGGSDRASETCTWSGFASAGTKFSTSASLNIDVSGSLTDPGGSVAPPQRATVTTSYGTITYSYTHTSGTSNVSYTIPAGTDISTVTVVGYVYAGLYDGNTSQLSFTKINITH